MGTINDPMAATNAVLQQYGVNPMAMTSTWSASDPSTWDMPGTMSTGKNGTAEDFYFDFYRQHPGDLPSLKQRLFNAGFYKDSITHTDQIDTGFDDDTKDAWNRAVNRTAAFQHAGTATTLNDVIGGITGAGGDASGIGSTRAAGAGARGQLRNVTHPDDIKTTAMKASTDILGYAFNEQQLSSFVTSFQQQERAAQQHGQLNPNLGNEAELAARKSNPVAASANDMSNSYGKFLSAIKLLESSS